MTSALVALAWTAAAALSQQGPAVTSVPDAPAPEPAVSVERVREGLARSPALNLQLPEANFKVQVIERHQWADLFKPRPEDEQSGEPVDPLAHVPLAGYNFASLIGKLVTNIKSARHAAAERNAQDEVDQAMDAFCATHDCSAVPSTK